MYFYFLCFLFRPASIIFFSFFSSYLIRIYSHLFPFHISPFLNSVSLLYFSSLFSFYYFLLSPLYPFVSLLLPLQYNVNVISHFFPLTLPLLLISFSFFPFTLLLFLISASFFFSHDIPLILHLSSLSFSCHTLYLSWSLSSSYPLILPLLISLINLIHFLSSFAPSFPTSLFSFHSPLVSSPSLLFFPFHFRCCPSSITPLLLLILFSFSLPSHHLTF